MLKNGQFQFNSDEVEVAQGGKFIMPATITTEVGQLEGTMIFLPKQLDLVTEDELDEATGDIKYGGTWKGISHAGRSVVVGKSFVRVSIFTPNNFEQRNKQEVTNVFAMEEA
jgi:hypothetical protein